MAKCGSAGGPVSVKVLLEIFSAQNIQPDAKEMAKLERYVGKEGLYVRRTICFVDFLITRVNIYIYLCRALLGNFP